MFLNKKSRVKFRIGKHSSRTNTDVREFAFVPSGKNMWRFCTREVLGPLFPTRKSVPAFLFGNAQGSLTVNRFLFSDDRHGNG